MTTSDRQRANRVILTVLCLGLVGASARCPSRSPYPQPTEAMGPSGAVTALAARADAVETGDIDEEGPFPLPLEAEPPLGSLIYDPAVSGRIAVVADADGFESGGLGPQWSTASSTPQGRIEVTSAQGAASGTFALLMDTTISGPSNGNEATWIIDLSGATEATLSFAHADFNDEEDPLPSDFIGIAIGDGVAISDDGVTWHTIFNATDGAFGIWNPVAVDLGAEAALAGMLLGSDFRIRFHQFDNFPLTTDGRGYDDLAIEVPGIDTDTFVVTIDPGQTITVVVEPDESLQPTVELTRAGSLLGGAVAQAPGEVLLLQTIDTRGTLAGNGPGPREYELTIGGSGDTLGGYTAQIILNAAVEDESLGGASNDVLATAQDLEPSFVPLLRAVGSDTSGLHPDRGAVLGRTESAGNESEFEPNDTIATAQDVDDGNWSLEFDPNVGDVSSNTSTSIPHLTIEGSGDGTFDYFSFTVSMAGELGIFDVDFGAGGTTGSMDTMLFLYDPDGNLLAANDDFSTLAGADGSISALDSFIQFSFPSAGTFVIGVAEFPSSGLPGGITGNPPDPGDTYTLQISLENHGVAPPSGDDLYRFELAAGETVTLTLTARSAGEVEIDLLDAGGGVVAEGLEHTELIVNGSFETGDFSGWTTTTIGSPFIPWQVSGAGAGAGFGMAPTAPREGAFEAWNGFDGDGPMEFRLSQDVTIPGDAPAAVLRWQDRVQWNFLLGGFASLPRLYRVEVRDPGSNAVLDTLFSFSTGTQATNPTGDTGWQTHTADLSTFAGSTVRVVFEEEIPQTFTGPGQIEFDAIGLSLGEAPTNVDDVVRFTAGESGTYFARVRSAGRVDYSLVVTRNADFDIEDNGDLASAQSLEASQAAGRRWVLGHIGSGGALYGASRFGELFTLDLASGAGALVGILPNAQSTEIEIDDSTRRAFSQFSDGSFAGQEFDIETGEGIGAPIFNGAAFNGMEYVGSALYATAIGGPRFPSNLHILDPFTGSSLLIGPTGVGPVSGLAYDEEAGVMYGIAGGPGPAALYTIDLATGAATAVGTTGFQAGSLEFGPDGALYGGGTGPDAGQLFRIDPATGAATLVGSTGFSSVTGLALRGTSAESDFFEINVGAQEPIHIETYTPAVQAGEFANEFDPLVNLYDAAGTLVASDDGSAPDGRNARLTFHTGPNGAGTYFVEITQSPDSPGKTGGEYILAIK